MGQKILVRLRPDNAPDSFLPEESIVGTMLHEVCIQHVLVLNPNPSFKIQNQFFFIIVNT
jgi:hypothetical protein